MNVIYDVFPLMLPVPERTTCARCGQAVLTAEAVAVVTPDGEWAGMAHDGECPE